MLDLCVVSALDQWQLLCRAAMKIVCVCAKLLQLCVTVCDPVDCSPPGSSVHRILQAKILEWVAIHFSRGSSLPKDKLTSLMSPALAGVFFATWEAIWVQILAPLHRDGETLGKFLLFFF